MENELTIWCENVDQTEVMAAILDEPRAVRLAEIFKLLGDPNRVRLLSLLFDREVCVQVLTEALDMSQSAVSHQLRVLRQMNLVRHRKDGRRVYYTLDDDHVRGLFQQGLLHVDHKAPRLSDSIEDDQ
ncbi:MAG: metalloregulator ArsR/SmtB family transcription factor [Aggregatilineales bacterium]